MTRLARAAALALLAAVALSGCIRYNVDMTVSADNTASGTVVIAVEKGIGEQAGLGSDEEALAQLFLVDARDLEGNGARIAIVAGILAEADEAAAMRDERWQAVQDRAGEVGVTVGLCESMVVEPELVADSIAWNDIFEGDEMLCVIPFGGAVNEGSVGKVRHKAGGKITVDFPEQRNYVYYRSHFERGDVKFIRRP